MEDEEMKINMELVKLHDSQEENNKEIAKAKRKKEKLLKQLEEVENEIVLKTALNEVLEETYRELLKECCEKFSEY